jgi:serine/threonine-protein kinase
MSSPSGDQRISSPHNSQPEIAGATNSIAVLPFVNMSADADNEYFCDGLAEELLNALAKIDDLKVAARTASFSFRGKNDSMAEIGRTLNVNSILEGSVRKAGNRVRITVQLINASDGYHLWSERYDRDMQDIFEVQDEITLAVIDALKVKLLGAEKKAVLRRHTNNSEAYQNYLRGRFFFFKRIAGDFQKAINYFEKAIDLDPEYAVAYSALAESYVFLGFYEILSPAEAESKLRPYLDRAVVIDGSLVETHTAAALVRSLYEWDFTGSLVDYDRAIAADEQYPFVYHLKSAVVVLLGRADEAFELEKRAIELDPFVAVFHASLGWWYYLAGRNDDALAQTYRTIEIAPNHFFAHWVQGLAYAERGSYSDGIISLQKSLSLNQFDQHIRADLGRVLARAGEREAAIEILNEFRKSGETQYVSPVNMAKIHVGLGDHEEVIRQLEIAVATRAVKLPWFISDPCLAPVWADPRFSDLVKRIGLPQISRSRKL